jgi:hypothetical protein
MAVIAWFRGATLHKQGRILDEEFSPAGVFICGGCGARIKSSSIAQMTHLYLLHLAENALREESSVHARKRCHPSLGFVIQIIVIRAALLLAGVAPGSLFDIDEMANKPGFLCSRASDSILRDLRSLTGPVASLLRGNSLAPLPALVPQDIQITSGLSSHQAILVLKQGCPHSPKLVRNLCCRCTMRHRLLAIPAVRNHLSLSEMESISRIIWSDFPPLPPRVPAVMSDGWGYLSQASIMELAMVGNHQLQSSIHAVDSLGPVGRLPAEVVEAALQATARIFNFIIIDYIALIPAALSHGGVSEGSIFPRRFPHTRPSLAGLVPASTIFMLNDRELQAPRGHGEKAALLACAIELLTKARSAAADICRFRAISASFRRAIETPFLSTIPPVGSVSHRQRYETSANLSCWGGFRPAEVTSILVVSTDAERATLASPTHSRILPTAAHPPVPPFASDPDLD